MTLTSDQCSVIALTVPVLLLALIVEARHVGVSRSSNFNVLLIMSNAITFFAALTGMGVELATIPTIFILVNVGVTFLLLAVLVFYADASEGR